MTMPADHLILQTFATVVLGLFAYYFGVEHGRKNPKRRPDLVADFEARETAETALAGLARVREELSVLRSDTLRDRDEIRDELVKQGRILKRNGQDVQDAVDRCMAEATKITMHMGQSQRRG